MYKKWKKIPPEELERLDKTLTNHLRKMKVKREKKQRLDFIYKILKLQHFTCAFADDDDKYCWNHPRNRQLDYLKLEWGHKIPMDKGEKSNFENNLILLCARCNNQIQTSRSVQELIPELEHKLKVLKKLV